MKYKRVFISEVGDNVTRLVTKLVLLSFLKPNSFIGLFVWSVFQSVFFFAQGRLYDLGQIDLSDCHYITSFKYIQCIPKNYSS